MKRTEAVRLTQVLIEADLRQVSKLHLIIRVIGVLAVVLGTGAPTEVPEVVHVLTNHTAVLPRATVAIVRVVAVRVHEVVAEAIEVQEAREVLVAVYEVLVVLRLDVLQGVDVLQAVDAAMALGIKPIS